MTDFQFYPMTFGSYQDPNLPCGVTQSMCEAGLIDENQPCGACNHELYWHDEEEFCHCCKEKHENCKYVYLCQEHKKEQPDEKEFTWYCSKNYEYADSHKQLVSKNCNHDDCLECATWKNLGKDKGRLYGKVYEKIDDRSYSYSYKQIEKKQNYHTIILKHSEAMDKWRKTVKACCKKNAEDGCKECDCKLYDDVPPEPDCDPYDD